MRKKLHTWEFQLNAIGGSLRSKLLERTSIGKTTECSKHLRHIAIEKDIFSELNRCIFQISLKYIKLVIPKILFILALWNFNFYLKITLLPPSTKLPHPHHPKISPLPPKQKFLTPYPRQSKAFSKNFTPLWRGWVECHECLVMKLLLTYKVDWSNLFILLSFLFTTFQIISFIWTASKKYFR